ncbi:iron reductase [Dendronalium sp. ChiSLP03b]|uniref:iron reductase n=1 Tax=Dendronalium sp. ChiSLP03b TaxID=3075381 RepID=UPI002AD74298|nr:iron reductase [Dendronalium sp. ChiSLP03b]
MRLKILLGKGYLVFCQLLIWGYITSALLTFVLKIAPLANVIGFVSLIYYSATIYPSIFKIVFPHFHKHTFIKALSKNRRYFGIAAFCFAVHHSIIVIFKKNLNLLNISTCIHTFTGLSILLIFTLLAVTSNDLSIKLLKNNWKKLHSLTYLVIFILPLHILLKMYGSWTYITPMAMIIVLVSFLIFSQKLTIQFIQSLNKQLINLYIKR